MIDVEFYEQGMGEKPMHTCTLPCVPRTGEVVAFGGRRHRVTGVVWELDFEAGRQSAEVIVETLETPEEEAARLDRDRAKGRRGSAE